MLEPNYLLIKITCVTIKFMDFLPKYFENKSEYTAELLPNATELTQELFYFSRKYNEIKHKKDSQIVIEREMLESKIKKILNQALETLTLDDFLPSPEDSIGVVGSLINSNVRTFSAYFEDKGRFVIERERVSTGGFSQYFYGGIDQYHSKAERGILPTIYRFTYRFPTIQTENTSVTLPALGDVSLPKTITEKEDIDSIIPGFGFIRYDDGELVRDNKNLSKEEKKLMDLADSLYNKYKDEGFEYGPLDISKTVF